MLPLLFLFAGVASAQAIFNVPMVDAAITGNAIYASTGAGLFRTTDDGVTWRSLTLRPRGQRQPYILNLHAHPSNPLIVYATTEAPDGALWRTTDGGESWAQWNSGLPQTGGFLDSLVILGGSTASLMYARIGDGIFKSVNAGQTWTRQASQPVAGGSLSINPRNPAFMLLGFSGGMYRTTDEGANWFLFPSLKIPPGANVASVLIDPFLPDVAYVGTTSPDGSTGGFYISTTAGPNSPEAGLGLVEPRIRPLVLYGPGPFNLFTTEAVCGTAQGRPAACFAKSTDNGRGWRVLGVALGFGGPVRLNFNPAAPANMVAATQRGIFVSSDAGENWLPREGRALPTLSLPPPIEFTLPPGGTGRVDNVVRVLESDRWFLPITSTASGEPWLTVTGGAGSTPLNLGIAVSAAGLAPGAYTASIRVNSPGAINDGATIPVRLTVTPPAASTVSYVLDTFAGTGQAGNFGDNGPANRAVIDVPDSLVFDSEGNLYFSAPARNVVRRIAPNGRITRFAGNGQSGFAGDDGQSLLATFSQPRGLAFGFGRVFVADSDNNRIRFSTTDSELLQSYIDGERGIERPRGIAFDEQGNLYAALPGLHVVVRIDSNRRATVFAGTRGQSGFRGDGLPAVSALLSAPLDVAVGPGGVVYIADTDNHRIRAVDPNGRIRTVAGNGLGGFQGDGDAATATSLSRPSGIAVDGAGNLIVGDTDNHLIRSVTPTGAIRTIAGTGAAGFAGDEAEATLGQLRSPADVAIDAQGVVYFSDSQNNRVRTLTPRERSTGPSISDGGVVNFADQTSRLAPGAVFSIFGSNLASGAAAAEGLPWSATLGGVSVTFDGQSAALSSVSPGQINGQVPWDVAGPVNVVVTVNGVESRPAPARIAPTAPAILPSTRGRALAFNEDGSQNSPAAPAAPGSVVTLYFTGQGAVDNRPELGAAAADDPVSQPLEAVSVTLRDRVEPDSARLAAGQVGVALVKFRVPQLPAGDHPAVVTVGGASSNSALIAVR